MSKYLFTPSNIIVSY